MEIGEKGLLILRALQRDATLTMQDLGKEVGMSQASVWRRVQDLEKTGVISARVALVDPRAVGLKASVITNVTLRDHSPESRAEFERFVTDRPEIMECYSVSGAYDYILSVRVEDVEAYERFLMNHLLASPVVVSAASAFTLRQLKYTTALPL